MSYFRVLILKTLPIGCNIRLYGPEYLTKTRPESGGSSQDTGLNTAKNNGIHPRLSGQIVHKLLHKQTEAVGLDKTQT